LQNPISNNEDRFCKTQHLQNTKFSRGCIYRFVGKQKNEKKRKKKNSVDVEFCKNGPQLIK